MSKSTTEQVKQAYYSGKDDRISSVAPVSQEGNKQNEERIDKLTVWNHSNKVNVEKFTLGDICMVSQTSRCLQFHIASIQKISEKKTYQ